MFKRLIFVSIFILLLYFSLDAFAAGISYFEFSPDSSSGLAIASVTDASQIFEPQNEYLSGVDLWLDDPGQGGNITLELRRMDDTLITSKTIAIGAIDPTPGGQRTHFNFPGQVSVIGNQQYKLKIISSIQNLNIYYSDRIFFIGHNQPQSSAYANGVANIDGVEQNYSFKFALYESAESSPPVLSNVTANNLTVNQTVISFNANEPVDYKVQYGLIGQGYDQQTDYTGNYQYCGSDVGPCFVYLAVDPGQTYDYLLTARDSWGNETQKTGNFTSASSDQSPTPTSSPNPTASQTPGPTQDPTDKTPPLISNSHLVSVGDRSVSVAWTTDEAANSSITVYLMPYLITIAAKNDPTLELEHFLESSDLEPSSPYQVVIRTTDQYNNESTAAINFTTLAPGATPSPSVQPSQSPQASSSPPVTTVNPDNPPQNTTVSWTAPANEPDNGYRVDIFDQNNKLITTVYVMRDVHQASIPDLENGKYKAVVYGNDGGTYKKIQQPKTITVGRTFSDYVLYSLAVLVALAVGFELFLKRGKKHLSPPVSGPSTMSPPPSNPPAITPGPV